MEKDYQNTWIDKENADDDMVYEGFSLYVESVYFTITTVATVGYGDISPVNTLERGLTIVIMIIGVSAFTFVSGALSSILSSYD